MRKQRFGEFLVSRGLIKERDVLEALDLQRKRTTPIGQVAVEQHLLTMKQVFNILNAQAETPEKRFGGLAVELGYLPQETIDTLLEAQVKSRPPIGELLVEMGRIERADMEAALKEFLGGPAVQT